MKYAILVALETALMLSSSGLAAESELDLLRARSRAQDVGFCNLHHVHMQRKLVRVCWQKETGSDAYYLTILHDFPNGEEFEDGGELMVPRLAHVKRWRYVCPRCKRAAKKWAAAHRDDPEAQCILSHY
jgi:hypothetical protein